MSSTQFLCVVNAMPFPVLETKNVVDVIVRPVQDGMSPAPCSLFKALHRMIHRNSDSYFVLRV